MAVIPCCNAFFREFRLPAAVFGPPARTFLSLFLQLPTMTSSQEGSVIHDPLIDSRDSRTARSVCPYMGKPVRSLPTCGQNVKCRSLFAAVNLVEYQTKIDGHDYRRLVINGTLHWFAGSEPARIPWLNCIDGKTDVHAISKMRGCPQSLL